MKRDYYDGLSFVYWFIIRKLKDLVLDQNQSLHWVVQREIVFTELRQDGADVEVDFCRVTHS